MLRLLLGAGIVVSVLGTTVAEGLAQQFVSGYGQTCTQVYRRCLLRREPRDQCTLRRGDCLQTGTFYDRNIVTIFLHQQ